MTPDISLKALRYFTAAIRAGSITEAAKVVNVVPSAVHTAVNQVEAAFGLQLTIRNRAKGISLTSTGQQMLPKIQNLLDEYESLMREGGDMRTQVSGVLRVGYYAPAAPAFMPQIIERILSENADVTVKFSECDNQSAQNGLISGAYDVIVCVANAMKPGVVDGGLPTRTAALRSLIRAAGGFLELKRSDFLDLGEINSELKAQGRNLNQLATALNKSAFRGGAALSSQDKTFLTEVKRAYASFDGRLSAAFREVRQKGRDAFQSGESL